MEQKRKNATHPVDKFVGVKLRQKRILSGMSQEDLGKALGLTFQQIQKYESGLNRISCSKLYELALLLNVSIEYFFEGFCFQDKQISSPSLLSENEGDIYSSVEEKEIMHLVKSYCNIEGEKIRKTIFNLIKAVSNETSEDNN
jgi:transcriptional regulator with XRE-family HTH domain